MVSFIQKCLLRGVPLYSEVSFKRGSTVHIATQTSDDDVTFLTFIGYKYELSLVLNDVTFLTFIGYNYELSLVLNGTAPIPDYSALENQLFQSLRHPQKITVATTPKARDAVTKTHFNYLLLDPRKNGGGKASNELEMFQVFVESVFYVGKGKNARSLQHLKDAQDLLKGKNRKVRTS